MVWQPGHGPGTAISVTSSRQGVTMNVGAPLPGVEFADTVDNSVSRRVSISGFPCTASGPTHQGALPHGHPSVRIAAPRGSGRCGLQRARPADSVTGPAVAAVPPPNPAACDPNSLNSLISGYFPGVQLDHRLAQAGDARRDDRGGQAKRRVRDPGFDRVGVAQPAFTGDPEAGSDLAQGVIRCMFDAGVPPASPPMRSMTSPRRSHTQPAVRFTYGAEQWRNRHRCGRLDRWDGHTVLSGVAPPPAIPPAATTDLGDPQPGTNAAAKGACSFMGIR